jgi:hypothetical protein
LGKIITPLIFALLVAIAVVAYPKFSGVHPANTPTVTNSPVKPQTISGRASGNDGDTIEIHGKTESPRLQSKSVVYYPGGDKPGTPYQTLEQCQRARQQAGNVGVCLMR